MVNLWLIIGITIYLVGGDWNMAFIFPLIILGMSSSQLTFTPSFFRGVGIPAEIQMEL